MRIVAGRFRGRPLAGPPAGAAGLRPTSDRLRETIFNVLAHAGLREDGGDACAGARVLDLFAGTGAMGLEALSRGASFAIFVDESGLARGLIRAHVEAFGLGGQTRLFRRDATRLGPVAPNEPADLVFCDPPYGRGLAPRALRSAAEGGWLTPGALVVVEEAAEAEALLPEGFTALDRRRSGDTQVVFARYTG